MIYPNIIFSLINKSLERHCEKALLVDHVGLHIIVIASDHRERGNPENIENWMATVASLLRHDGLGLCL